MSKFTEKENEEIQSILQQSKKSIERKRKLKEDGKVPDKKLPTLYSSIGDLYKKIGIINTYNSRLEKAKCNFRSSAEYHFSSGKENSVEVSSTLPLGRSIYMAAISGGLSQARLSADTIRRLHQNHTLDPEHPQADRFYFSGCLAGIIVNDSVDEELAYLAEVNQNKPKVDALYGEAILEYTHGICDSDPDQICRGVSVMIQHHNQTIDNNSIISQIMSIQATALLVIARQQGYDVTVNSEFIPDRLVAAVTDGSPNEF